MPSRPGYVWPILIVALSLIGMVTGVLSTLDHLTYMTAGGGKGFCSAFSETACAWAHTSPAAELLGVPISLWGVGFYFGFAAHAPGIWNAIRRKSQGTGPWAPLFLTLSAAGAVAYSIHLAYLLLTAGGSCPFCFVLYGVNSGLLAVSMAWAWPVIRNHGLWKTAATKNLLPGLSFFSMAGLAFFPASEWYKAELADIESIEAREDRPVDAAGHPGDTTHFHMPVLSDDVPSKGSQTAPATLIEFSDFECSYCAAMHRVISTLYAHVGADRLRVRFVNFPLDNSCNCYVTACLHETACLAARAAICAQRGGAFWEFADMSFTNRRQHDRDDLIGYAIKVGLDEAAFESCLESAETTEALLDDIETAHDAGVKATPTVVVNGLKFEGLMPLDRLQETLDRSEVCACDLAAEYCNSDGDLRPSSCDMEVVDRPSSCD